MTTFKQLSDIDGRIQSDYDADFYHGAPVALQVVGRRLEEEKVLEMCEVIADALKKLELQKLSSFLRVTDSSCNRLLVGHFPH